MRNAVTGEIDYIVVGGGSSGCTLAGRLSEDRNVSIALLEEGPRDWSPYIHLPVTYYKTAQGPLLRRYNYELSAAQAPDVTASMVQARVLGGGSSVNAMLYVRGAPADYDGWAELGAAGWSYRDVLPYFRRAENNDLFFNEVHGTGGPLGVSTPLTIHPLTKLWLQACQQAGLPYNDDFNSGEQAGCGLYQTTTRNGRRSSAAGAYLSDARSRPNLAIHTGCQVRRVIFEKNRAIGVECAHKGKTIALYANREVILTAGALVTPKLLMLSGIGPTDHLRKHGIEVLLDLPGVGRNYQDHMELSLVYKLTGPHSYDKYKKFGWKAWAGLQYALFGNGPVASNIIEGGAFWWSSMRDVLPDIQLFFLAGAGVEEGVDGIPGGSGCTISVTQTRPKSIGFVELKGADASLPPRIVPNYLNDPKDLACMVDAVRLAQEIMQQPVIAKYVERSHVPERPLQSRAELEAFVRREAHAGLHPSGTCRMGTDNQAVIDPQLRVHGIDGLRIADMSVIPKMVSGNLNSVAIMIGEKASDLIRGRSAS